MKAAIEQAFATAAKRNRSAFIPYLTGGFPDASTCEELLIALDANGADIIEVGIPFSDPLADGPTIQWAAKQALDRGTTPRGVLDLISRVRPKVDCPMVVMTYVNPVFRMGADEFAARSADAGVSGVIIPDLPPEEADEWKEAAEKRGIATIFLVAPTTPPARMELVSSKSTGFLYYVSMTGVTGKDCSVSEELLREVRQAKRVARTPVAVGFGISTPAQAASLAGVADGVIVGSAVIRGIQRHESPAEQIEATSRLCSSLSAALDRGGNP